MYEEVDVYDSPRKIPKKMYGSDLEEVVEDIDEGERDEWQNAGVAKRERNDDERGKIGFVGLCVRCMRKIKLGNFKSRKRTQRGRRRVDGKSGRSVRNNVGATLFLDGRKREKITILLLMDGSNIEVFLIAFHSSKMLLRLMSRVSFLHSTLGKV